ncbi:EAL domain-containing protein [Vibrio sp. PNB22_4_2]
MTNTFKIKHVVDAVKFNIAIFTSVMIAFALSSFFVIAYDTYQVISFVSAILVVCFFRYDSKALAPTFLGLLVYYLYTNRAFDTSAVIAATTILIHFICCKLFKLLLNKQEHSTVFSAMKLYFIVFGCMLPILGAITFSLLKYWFNDAPTSSTFFIYSALGLYLTQLLVTPLLHVALNALLKDRTNGITQLDDNLRVSSSRELGYIAWLGMCVVIMAVAVSHSSPLLANILCFLLLIVIVSGFGRHGLIRPLLLGSVAILTIIQNEIHRVNLNYGHYANFLEWIVIAAVTTTLAYLLGSQSIRRYELAQKQIQYERIDPYTGLYNIAQLKEDLELHGSLVLVYLDLAPTISKISDLDHEGKTQLIQQLHDYLCKGITSLPHCFRPPFSIGILGYALRDSRINSNLNRLTKYLDEFQFYWQGTSISLVLPTLHCTHASLDDDIEKTVSALCDQQPNYGQSIRWLDAHHVPVRGLDKLSFIQQVFKKGMFELYCQPYAKLNGKQDNACSFEVLLRIKNIDGTYLSPAEIFPLINQFGLEVELDHWVIDNTFKMLSGSVRDWSHIEKCAINLTAKTLGVEHLADSIINQAKAFNIPLSRICFEITESAAFQNEQQAIDTLVAMRTAGCKIAIDDFGTGYASFAYLRKLPLDILKIDGAFVINLPNSETDRLIVNSICNVADDMHLETVAEFVETEKHIEILKNLGITYAQGYGVAKPRPLLTFLNTF